MCALITNHIILVYKLDRDVTGHKEIIGSVCSLIEDRM
jgi:hypothetical protein